MYICICYALSYIQTVLDCNSVRNIQISTLLPLGGNINCSQQEKLQIVAVQYKSSFDVLLTLELAEFQTYSLWRMCDKNRVKGLSQMRKIIISRWCWNRKILVCWKWEFLYGFYGSFVFELEFSLFTVFVVWGGKWSCRYVSCSGLSAWVCWTFPRHRILFIW